jgi:hypothetical protein
MLLVVTTQRRLDEQPHALRRHRLVQEAIDLAAGDLRRELPLVLGAAGDHQHQVRELLAQPRSQLRDRAGHGGGVDQRDATTARHHALGQLGFAGADRDGVVGRDHFLERVEERVVL